MPSIIRATTTSGLQVAPDNSGSLQLQTNGTNTAVTIDTSQNVGIGTTSPTSKLDINGSINLGQSYINLASPNGASGDFASGYNVKYSGASVINTTTGASTAISYATDSIRFYTNTSQASGNALTERMRIDSSGGLSVGTSDNSPTSGNGFKYTQNGTNPYLAMVVASSSGQNNYHLYSTGAAAFRFYVSSAGAINATSTSITAISDISLKENIRDLETGLSEVMALRPKRFDWKEEVKIPEKNIAGFIAQEVEQVLPELVYEYQYDTNVTKKALKMGDILPTLVKAIQEQQTIINDLKARVETLEAK